MISNETGKQDYIAIENQKYLPSKSTKTEKLFKSRNMYSDFNYNYDYNLWEKDQLNKTLDYSQIEAPFQQIQQENSASVSSRIYGLLPVEYDGGFVDDNASSVFRVFYAPENETLTTNENQFSTPIMYILCMMVIYGFIILVVCIYALYSHRKRIGYNYDEHLDGYSSSEDIEELIGERSKYLSNLSDSDKKVGIQTNCINVVRSNTETKVSPKIDNKPLENSSSDENSEDDESNQKNFICIEMKACKNSYEKLATDDEQEENQFSDKVSPILKNYFDKFFQYFFTNNDYIRVNSNEKKRNSEINRTHSNALKSSFKISTLTNLSNENNNNSRNKNRNSPLILDVEKIYVENIL